MARIVIMGASSGIGYALAEAFASRGIKTGVAARSTKSLEELKSKYPDCVEYASIDVTRDDAPTLLNDLINRLGGMDLYLHGSGIGYENPELDPEKEASVINTNAAGFARMLAAAYNYFHTNGLKGRIAAITSVAGTKGIGKMAAYSASKRCARTYMVALEQLANSRGDDIRFTDIRPGWIRTPLLSDEKQYPLEMTVADAVPRIIKALIDAPRVAYIGWKWDVICRIWALIPDALWVRISPERMVP